MKIAVLGTSNSVLTSGYFETYKAIEYPNQVDLFAIGGTVISFAAFALEYFQILKNYDVIITEFSTNDAHRYEKKLSAQNTCTNIFMMFSLPYGKPANRI